MKANRTMRKLVFAAALILLASPAAAMPWNKGPLEAVQKHFKPLCAKGPVKLPAWPALTGEDGKRLREIRKLTGASRQAAFAEWAIPKAKKCKELLNVVVAGAKLTGEGKTNFLLTYLFEDEESMDLLDDCDHSAPEMIAILRGSMVGFDTKNLQGAGRGADCKQAAKVPASAQSGAAEAPVSLIEESSKDDQEFGALVPEPTAKDDDKSKGGLTPQEIMVVIRANLNQIRNCYEKLLKRQPNAAGKIAVNFVVAKGTGKVKKGVAITTATISDKEMQACVTATISNWRFPKPRQNQDVTINYPFVFNPL